LISGKSSLCISAEEVKTLLREGEICITVVGLGRIGLPTAASFANAGAKVYGVDINESVVGTINSGENRFVDEPGLEDMLRKVVKEGKLHATLRAEPVISKSDFLILSVPTPVLPSKTPDYSAIRTVSHQVGEYMKSGTTVIVESTVGPGTVENLIAPILEAESGMKVDADFGLASAPERSDPGNIMKNLTSVPRVVGASNSRTRDIVAALYEATFGVEVVKVSSPRTANAVKLTENLFRDVNIALANEFALLYEKLGIDVIEVIKACSTKYNFMPHYPGAGVGGPCLPANPYYLIEEALKVGDIPYLIRMAREINDRMPEHIVELTMEALNEVAKTVRGSKIGVLGISYKPNVKDVQLSPIVSICSRLQEMGAILKIYDPLFPAERAAGFDVLDSVEKAVSNSDCILFGVAHEKFKHLDLGYLRSLSGNRSAVVDACHLIDPQEAMKLGFAYRGVGRPRSRNLEVF